MGRRPQQDFSMSLTGRVPGKSRPIEGNCVAGHYTELTFITFPLQFLTAYQHSHGNI